MTHQRNAADGSDTSTWWVGRILSYAAFFAALAILAATIVVPRITGALPYTILTSSMEPTYPPGTLIVVRPVTASDLRLGTPITYQVESGRPEVVTHRIVRISNSADGDVRYVARGDANTVDDEPIRLEQIRGAVWYSIPFIGYVNTWINGEQRRISVLVISGLLGAYALVMFGATLRDRGRDKEDAE